MINVGQIIKNEILKAQIILLKQRIVELRSEPIPDTEAINNLQENINAAERLIENEGQATT